MKRNALNFIAITGISILLAITGCNRETNLGFSDLDLNNDNEINKLEFTEVFTDNFYQDWNKTDDEYLDDDEFHQVVYNVWDANDDRRLSEEEWTMGYDYYYGAHVIVDYDKIDLNKDNYLVMNEFENVLTGTNFFVEWDTDKNLQIDEKELAHGVFERWDIDNSGKLEPDEFAEFDSYYLDI